jgi:hypothetical protein
MGGLTKHQLVGLMVGTMIPSWFIEVSARAAAGVALPTVARHHAAAVQHSM